MARFWQSRFDHLEDQQQAYQDAKGGWQQFIAALEQVVARVD